MDYRNKFYSKYISSHTACLYSKPTLKEIKKQFPIWQKYFGKFLPENKDAKIIELGCGSGGFIYWFKQIGYQVAEGVDISIEQVEIAKKLGIKNIYQADIKNFLNNSITNNSITKYDVVIMRDILEHFTKDEILDILELVYKSLKNNGIIIIQVPNAENPFSGRLRYGDFTHEIGFTANSVRQALLIFSFENIAVYGTPPVIHGIKSFIRFILWKIIEFCLRFYVIIETGSGKMIFTQNIIVIAKK